MTRRVAPALALIFLLATCGDDDSTPADPVSDATTRSTLTAERAAPVCAPLRAVYEMDQAFGEALAGIAPGGTPEDTAAALTAFLAAAEQIEPLLDEIIGHYDDALSVAPPELVENITIVRDGTVVLWNLVFETLEQTSTVDDFIAAFETLFAAPGVTEQAFAAAGATLLLDRFTVPECGFALSS